MKWIVDRIEENSTVVECGKEIFNIPKLVLPPDVAEGDVLDISINKEETNKRKEEASDMLKDLFSN